jgi:hypothetical protein
MSNVPVDELVSNVSIYVDELASNVSVIEFSVCERMFHLV